jgi:hypothetical protein
MADQHPQQRELDRGTAGAQDQVGKPGHRQGKMARHNPPAVTQ